LRKIGAYLLGVFLLLLLGAVLLHPSLLAIADWLGPVIGSSVYGGMTMAFLMIGDPIGYPIILVIWLLVALVVGGIIRRRLGAVLVGLFIWLTMIPISASLVFVIAQRIQESSQSMTGPLAGLPPIPSELNLATIFNAPIIGDVAKKALLAMSSEAGGQRLVEEILSSFIVGIFSKPLIMVVGVLMGVELARLIQKRGIGGGWSLRGAKTPKVAALLVILCISFSSLVPSASGLQIRTDSYSETLVGTMDKNGRAYVGDMFVQMGSNLSGMGVSASDADGLAVAVVVSQSGVVEEFRNKLSSESLGEMGSLLNLLPPTFAVIVYLDVSKDVATQRSVSVSRVLSSTYGVDLSQLTSFSFRPSENDTENVPMITVSIFQSSSDVDVLARNYLTKFTGRGGFVDVVKSAVVSGRLIPDRADGSASGSIFAAGFVNVNALKAYFPGEEVPAEMSEFYNELGGSIDFAGGVSFWRRGEQPSGNNGDVDVLTLLGVSGVPSYSADSDLSIFMTFALPSDKSTEGQKVNISTNAALSADELDALKGFFEKQGYSVDINQGALTLSDFVIDTGSLTLPPNVVVTKTITGDSTLTVTIKVENRDTKPITDVTIDDSSSLNNYDDADLVSGSPKSTLGAINPGETRTITYTIRVDQPGVYTFDSATVTYAGGGETYRDTTNTVETPPKRPFPLLIPFELLALTWTTGSQLLDMATGRGVLIMSVVTLAVVLFFVWEGVKSYKRWKSGKTPSVAPQVVDGYTPAAPQ